ncbi:flagellar basal body-associated FliL family protein [Treponema lecithinolyticum]|uniref:flagellar basal body-associated FliL family protein n=1 Tax=Treponema lecithinolyticum TaxID=53418 RepID=UPI0028E28E92|nr:flagellar basal body-associated FliL family protein [Treponema lecithinolyticum]
MADDDLNLDEGDSALASAPKKGGMGGLLPTLLKWIAIVVGAIILIVTVVVVTMSIINSNSPSTAAVPVSQEYQPKRPEYDWYQSIPEVRAKTVDTMPASVIVNVVLGYKKDDKVASNEITARKVEIQDYLRKYFSSKKIAELRPQYEDMLKLEIKNDINDILTSSSIRDVRFLKFEIVEQ